jgi:hypothetical protein
MTMPRVVAGLIGGAAGCAVMTLFMRRAHRELPPEDQHPLPPRHIAMRLADKSGLGRPSDEEDRKKLTLAAHYGYGTSLGAVYALMAPDTRWAPLIAGVPFGLAVWSGSYLGWLPATGLYPSATEESAPRNALMIAAHLIWAGTIATVVEMFRTDDGLTVDEAPRRSMLV